MRRNLCWLLPFVFVLLTSGRVPAQAGPAVKPKEPNPNPHLAPVCADHHTFHSAALDREMAYCILLPPNYNSSQERYAVLYLLHGLHGDENDWLGKTRLATNATEVKLLIVMPEGNDSWYTNSVADPRNRYEDYIAADLIREIESHYHVNASRDARFIAGLSMGGYGALKMGIKHPELFSIVGAFSAAVLNAQTRTPHETVEAAFGPVGGPARSENNLYVLMAKADKNKLPYFMLTCGTSDDLRDDDLHMADLMHLLGIKYEYYEFPGVHEWPVWNRSAAMMLLYLRAFHAVAGAGSPQDAPK